MLSNSADENNFFSILTRIQDLYITYRGRYVESSPAGMRIPKVKVNDEWVYKRLDNKTVARHLNEAFAVCVYAGEWSSRFICFDVDLHDEDLIHRLIDAIEAYGFPRDRIYVSTSGGKGYHVELFFDGLIYTSELRSFYNYICMQNNFDRAKVEFRPTKGQAIKLPLSRHAKTGNICWYLDRETLQPIKSKSYILEIKQISADKAKQIIFSHGGTFWDDPDIEKRQNKAPKPKVFHLEEDYPDEYPELRAVGTTHNTIVAIATRERYLNTPKDKIREKLNEWLDRQNPKFFTDPVSDIRKDIDEVAEWVYGRKFHTATKNGAFITAKDLNYCLEARTPAGRKTLLLLLVGYKHHRPYSITYRRLGKILDVSEKTVSKTLTYLKDNNKITCKVHGKICNDGTFTQLPNTYYFHDNLIIKKQLFKPLVESVAVDEEITTPDTFRAVWKRVINTMVGEADQKKIFTDKELEELHNDGV